MNWQNRIYESVIDIDKPTKPKPKVKRANPHAHLPRHLQDLIEKGRKKKKS